MSEKIPFTKMHGLGNDYVYIWEPLLPPSANLPELSVRWSNRHTGIGSDGLILIGPSTLAEADFKMRIFNADGSEATMCGNGARCVARFLHDKRLTEKTYIALETLSGIKQLMLHPDDEGTVETVTVDMGVAVVGETLDVDTCKGIVRGTLVDMGNPHFVLFVDDAMAAPVREVGMELQQSPLFPDGVNVEFAQVIDSTHIRMRVWERGSGITQACGSGASATAVACAAAALTNNENCEVTMDGGPLSISWNRQTGHVLMTGSATMVFEGEIECPTPTKSQQQACSLPTTESQQQT